MQHYIILGLAASALVAWPLAAVTYYVFRRWVRQARSARIAVYYKRRAVLEAPLADWMAWADMLDADTEANGRIVYRGGHVSLMIVKAGTR